MNPLRKSAGDVINNGSLALLLFFAVMEVEIYTAGGPLVRMAGRDAWLSVILGALGSYLILYIYYRLALRFPAKNFYEYTPLVWGKSLSYPIILVFIAYLFLWLVRTLWRVGDINTIFFLPNTPILVVLLIFTVGAVLLASYGLVPIARFAELMLLFFFVPYLFTMCIALANSSIRYLLPFLENGLLSVIKGAGMYLIILQGLEIILFAIPLAQNPQKTFLPAAVGLTILHFSTLLQFSAMLGNLGSTTVKELQYPGYDMLGTLNVPGWPVERYELFLTLPWLIGVFTSTAICIYLVSQGFLNIIPHKNPKLFFWAVGLLAIACTYLIPNNQWGVFLDEPLRIMTLLAVYLLPPISYGLSLLREKKEDDRE